MFIAQIKDTDTRIHIDEAINDNITRDYICPICKGQVVLKTGHVISSHFAHKSLDDCDTFTSDMSEWHKSWQNLFPKRNQEVVLELEVTYDDYEMAAVANHFDSSKYLSINICNDTFTIKHRADVLACGYVIEFQHSPISCSEFNERNWFYNKCGYTVVWVFDYVSEYKSHKIRCIGELHNKYDDGGKYKWSYASKTFSDFVPHDHKSQYIDGTYERGDIIVLFQIDNEIIGDGEECLLERVIWASPSFKDFYTSYYPSSKLELLDYVKNKKL